MGIFSDKINKTINTLDSLSNLERTKVDSVTTVLDSLSQRPMYQQSMESMTISEEDIPIAETLGEKAREDIVSSIAGLDIGSEKFKEELDEYKSDSEKVFKLTKEFESIKLLRNQAYDQAYPRWHDKVFPDFTYNSDEQEKIYNQLSSRKQQVGIEINKIKNKWYDLDDGTKSRAGLLRKSLGILHDKAGKIEDMRTDYFATFGEPVEGSIDVNELMYEDLKDEKILKEELNMKD